MATLVSRGDRLQTLSGRDSWMSRPSVPFSTYAGGGSLRLTGESSISYASLYRTQPWVGISVNKLARQIARLPLKVYRKDAKGDRERVREGRLVDLLTTPWERGSASDLKQALAFPALLHGNGVLTMYREERGGPPSSLIPLDWRFITAHHDQYGGPIYMWETEQTGQKRYLPPEEVVHAKWWAPDCPIGVSPLEQVGVTIRLEDAAQRYATSSFDNGVRTSGALVLPPDVDLDDAERREMRQEIQQTHGGVDNAFKMMLLSGGVDFKSFAQTAKEAELIDSRKLNREEVAAVYDIPPPLIGILDHATYSNVAEMHRMLYKTVLGPWLDLIEQTLQSQLIDPEPEFAGQFVEFDLDEVLKGDAKERVGALKEGIGTGLYTINEARKVENLPRIDNKLADQPLIPVNNLAPLGSQPDQAPADPVPPMLASHVRRARDRVLSRTAAGVEDPLDAERFRRELEADLTQHLNGDAGSLAALWTQVVIDGIESAGGDSDQLKQFFGALGA